jgi:acetylglutamate synthase
MFWRTRSNNPIAAWYAEVSDGMIRMADWHVFWRGIEPALIPELVDFALAIKDDFVR